MFSRLQLFGTKGQFSYEFWKNWTHIHLKLLIGLTNSSTGEGKSETAKLEENSSQWSQETCSWTVRRLFNEGRIWKLKLAIFWFVRWDQKYLKLFTHPTPASLNAGVTLIFLTELSQNGRSECHTVEKETASEFCLRWVWEKNERKRKGEKKDRKCPENIRLNQNSKQDCAHYLDKELLRMQNSKSK